jgi:hypothetical protein
MVIVAFWPFFEFGMFYSKIWLERRMDGSYKDGYNTKKTNMHQYVDLHSGPEYFIHFKYSSVLNIAFVTMMYGSGIPILYPIAVVAYLVFYILERVMVAYFYQLPPTFDD